MSKPQQCPTGKVPLLEYQLAQYRARRSSARHERAITAYRCAECGAWHLGGSSKLRRPLPIINRIHHVRFFE